VGASCLSAAALHATPLSMFTAQNLLVACYLPEDRGSGQEAANVVLIFS